MASVSSSKHVVEEMKVKLDSTTINNSHALYLRLSSYSKLNLLKFGTTYFSFQFRLIIFYTQKLYWQIERDRISLFMDSIYRSVTRIKFKLFGFDWLVNQINVIKFDWSVARMKLKIYGFDWSVPGMKLKSSRFVPKQS